MSKRTGARNRASIPTETLAALNQGKLEAANLVEGLAIDFAVLMKHAAPSVSPHFNKSYDPQAGITQRMIVAGQALAEQLGSDGYDQLKVHPSDTVRGWAAYLLSSLPKLTLKQRLERLKPLADDPHFGVREWAWLAVRHHVAADIQAAIKLLTPWASHRATGLRRFASEATRPRGVWCAHLEELKTDPALGLPILDQLHNDPERYVQDSVANWLNDAGKSQPEWVKETCARWLAQSQSPATAYIVKRAQRSLR
jgi:3-methyladenine DNA glycosylase AlkC